MGFKEDVAAAKVKNLISEARYSESQADLNLIEQDVRREELRTTRTRADIAELTLQNEIDRNDVYMASDDHHRTVRFLGSVGKTSVEVAVEKLTVFHRIDPTCDITFIIDSPGGGIIEGFHLFDTILWLRNEGHEVKTIANGMAASMGGVLLQAGSKRYMTPQSSMLIHEAAFGAGGSMGTVEDQVAYVKKLQERILFILAERSTMDEKQIKSKWNRKNWWIMAEEALELGFIDGIK